MPPPSPKPWTPAARPTAPPKDAAMPSLVDKRTLVGPFNAAAAGASTSTSVPLAQQSADAASAMGPSGGCRISVNGIACDLDVPRVIPDLLFGNHVLLKDTVTQRLLLPNGIDHSVRVVPDRAYVTVKLVGGACELVNAGFFEEDQRLLPRSWVLDAVSANYRAGAANFYSSIPTLGEHMAQWVRQAEEAKGGAKAPPQEGKAEESPQSESNHGYSQRRAARRKAAKRDARIAEDETGHDGAEYSPLLLTLPTADAALDAHPVTLSSKAHAQFVRLRDQFNEAARLQYRLQRQAPADGAGASAVPLRPAAAEWALRAVGAVHRNMTGLQAFIRETPSVNLATARAAYRALEPEQKAFYKQLASEMNDAARLVTEDSRVGAVAATQLAYLTQTQTQTQRDTTLVPPAPRNHTQQAPSSAGVASSVVTSDTEQETKPARQPRKRHRPEPTNLFRSADAGRRAPVPHHVHVTQPPTAAPPAAGSFAAAAAGSSMMTAASQLSQSSALGLLTSQYSGVGGLGAGDEWSW
jgi:hypothetical protein